MGIECDVQESRDGRAMVFHDWTLDRLTGETGPVAARDAAALEAIALAVGGDRIPTLDRLLEQVAGRVPLLIEVKSKRERDPVSLCRAVKSALEGYAGSAAVMSFDPRVPNWFARHDPAIVRGLVVTEENARGPTGCFNRRLSLWHAKPDFLAYDVRDLPSRFAAALRGRGLPLLTWTVRSPELRVRAAAHADAPIAEGAGLA
jgi:glycerophosphoryl diester phosphodiesterase